MLDRLSQVLLQEGHRLKAWGILDSGTGAELLRPGEHKLATVRAPMTLELVFKVSGPKKLKSFSPKDSAGEVQ